MDALIQINDSSGSGNVRKYTFELIRELAKQDNPNVAFSAYHTGYQIFPKDPDALLTLLQSMNQRLSERRGGGSDRIDA